MIAGLALATLLLLGVTAPLRLDQHAPSLQTNLASETGETWRGALRYALLALALLAVWMTALRAALTLRGRAAHALLAGGVLLGVILLPAHPTYSSDVFHYAATARVAFTYGANPLTTPPDTYPDDPLMRLSGWASLPSPYGPLWTWLSAVPYWASGGATDATRITLAFKVLALAGVVIAAAGIGSAAERLHAGTAAAAVVTFAWNPVVLIQFAADGHNDAIMLAIMAWSVVALLYGRLTLTLTGGFLAAALKAAAIIALVAFAVRLVIERRYATLLVGGAAGAMLLVFAFAPLWEGAETLRTSRDESSYFTNSPASLVLRLASAGGMGGRGELAISLATRLMLVALLVYLVFSAGASRERLIVATGIVYLFAAGLLSTWFQPWYLTWPLLYFAVTPGRSDIRLLAFAVTLGGLLVPLATNFAPAIGGWDVNSAPIDLLAVILAHGPVVVALLAVWRVSGRGPAGMAALR